MATSNFGRPRYNLPLIVCVPDIEWGEDEAEYLMDDLYEEEKQEVEEYNKDLKWFKIIIEPGYYEGFWFNVKFDTDYWSFEELDELTDEDAEYFWGEKASTVKEQVAAEVEKVKKIFEKLGEHCTKIGVVGSFSNGETIYKRV